MQKLIFEFSIYLISFVFLNSCGLKKDGSAPSMVISSPSIAPATPPTTQTKEEELATLVVEFKTTYAANFIFVPDFKPASYMNSGGGGTTTVGVCEVYSDGSKQVHMNQDWWPTAAALAKKILVFHELGHCFFNRMHDSRMYSGGRPYSIMNPIIDPVVAFFNANVTYYTNELANPIALQINEPVRFMTFIDGTCVDLPNQ